MNPYELTRRAGRADFETTIRHIHMAGPNGDREGKTNQELSGTNKNPTGPTSPSSSFTIAGDHIEVPCISDRREVYR